MDRTRIKGLQAIIFGLLAIFILMQGESLGSPRPSTLAVGLVVVLLALWEAARGRASLFFRKVNKADAPTLFWVAVVSTALLGIACVALSYI